MRKKGDFIIPKIYYVNFISGCDTLSQYPRPDRIIFYFFRVFNVQFVVQELSFPHFCGNGLFCIFKMDFHRSFRYWKENFNQRPNGQSTSSILYYLNFSGSSVVGKIFPCAIRFRVI
jgi:hypothetical protein